MIAVVALGTLMSTSSLVAVDLRCEALSEPLSLQTGAPELSWKLEAVQTLAKNLAQTGYRVRVASDEGKLLSGKSDLWDSGVVASSATFGISYGGPALPSRATAWWQVQVRDQAGQLSGWSKPATFATGLMTESEWSAKWIHGNRPFKPADSLAAASWIWAYPDANREAPAETRIFSRLISVASVRSAHIRLSVDDQFALRVNGREVAKVTEDDSWRTVREYNIAQDLHPGENKIEIEATNSRQSPAGAIGAVEIVDAAGRKTVVVTDASWQVEKHAAAELGRNGVAPWGRVNGAGFVTAPAQYFEKSFEPKSRVRRAIAYVSALGIVDPTLNGQRLTDDLFTPGWTDYRKRVYYRAFDVTKLIRSGSNQLGAVLGQGWYSGYVAWGAQRDHYGDTPMLRMQLELEFADGQRQIEGTDSSWRVGTGPIMDEHFLHGEKYDARLTPNPWRRAIVSEPAVKIEAFTGEPVRAYTTIEPKSIRPVAAGTYQINFGQNLSGFVRLRVNEPAGTKITIRHAERLDPKGRIYTTNLRLAQAIDTYTCRGGGVEEWAPRFTFHGFQYIEVTGLDHSPSRDTFTAVAISSATPESGSLETSDPMLNKLVKNAWWTQKMNFVDVPTDCPQRDERLGWTGDAQAYVRTATYYSDVQSFFKKWLVALDDSQTPDGQYPKVAPVISGLTDGGPAWADAGVICPMTIYDAYGDRALLAKHYPNMLRFIEFCRGRAKANLLPPNEFHCFGDWLNINADTPNEVIMQAYFAGSTALVARAAHDLGYVADEAKLTALHDAIKRSFVQAYVSPTGVVRGDTQCGYVLALAFDLLDAPTAKLAADRLIADIEKRGWHLSTGFVGTRDLMHVLSKIGRDDVAYRLLHNTTFPSWGFSIVNGATSIWERWDGWTPEKGFQDPGMNSFAHYAYGAVVGWMFKTVGGISELEPGYGKILIAPKIDPNLTWAKTTYNSVRGPISTFWRKTSVGIELVVSVPPNATAEVRVPKGDGSSRAETVGSGTWTWKQ